MKRVGNTCQYRESTFVHQYREKRVYSLVPRPLERPGNQASVCSAAVAVVTNIICSHNVIIVSRGVQDQCFPQGPIQTECFMF